MRKPAARTKPRTAKPASFPAPVGGWIKNQNLAAPGSRLPDGSRVNGAYLLENWFPIATGLRMRGGSQVFATLGDGTRDPTAMFAYANGNNRKLFGANAIGIYDITAGGTVAAPAVGGLTGGAWSVIQFATPGGVFLRGVNGLDTPQVFDGTSWSTAPAITGVTATALSQVWSYKQRLFFVESGTLNAWYLPVDTVGGAAVKLPLGGVFKRGGSLLFGASWSLDGGGGLTEQCIFVSTEGEVAVYQGTDPSSPSAWSRVGVYRIGKPLGAKAWIHAGGDLVIATDIGFVPLSQAVQRDLAALSPAAISFPIETAWNEAVAARSGQDWNCEVWPTKQMVLVAMPTLSGQSPQMFAANARTGAWTRYTAWNGTCLQLFGARMFFGSTGGNIIEAEVTGADQGVSYTATCVPQFDPLKAPASLKTSLLMRAILRSPEEVVPQLSLQADYVVNLPAVPDALQLAATDLWGVGVWGVAKWGVDVALKIFERWQSVGGSGYAIAPATQLTTGSVTTPNVELVQVDITYDMGDVGS
jgi:hypothetical protein